MFCQSVLCRFVSILAYKFFLIYRFIVYLFVSLISLFSLVKVILVIKKRHLLKATGHQFARI